MRVDQASWLVGWQRGERCWYWELQLPTDDCGPIMLDVGPRIIMAGTETGGWMVGTMVDITHSIPTYSDIISPQICVMEMSTVIRWNM